MDIKAYQEKFSMFNNNIKFIKKRTYNKTKNKNKKNDIFKICMNCNMQKDKKSVYIFKNIQYLLKKIQILSRNSKNRINNDFSNMKFDSTKIICKDCFFKIMKSENFEDKIINIFMPLNQKTKENIVINENNHTKEYENIQVNEDKNIYIKEFDSCLASIVQYLKSVTFEVSCFVQSYLNYIKNIHNLTKNNYLELLFQNYCQTKFRLGNLFNFGFDIIYKFKFISNKIILLSNISESNNINNNNVQNIISIFIANNCSILSILYNFVHNFNVCLDIFK